jgi:hypothetical protein
LAEQIVSRLGLGPGADRDDRTQAIRAERERLAREQPTRCLRERVKVGPGGRNVVEWFRDDAEEE